MIPSSQSITGQTAADAGTRSFRVLLAAALISAAVDLIRSTVHADTSGRERPNVLFILVDDLGYGDFGCTGSMQGLTPNIDRLAAEGTLITNFYVASPICSPSRVAFTTGQYPARHRFHSFLSARADNERKGMPDWLDPEAPSLARIFQQAGYATGHFGKWHMGGGRDVGDAPLPQAYGFDASLTSFEGLGDRILPPGRLSDQSAQLGRGEIRRVAKAEMTGIYVDRTIEFIESHAGRPWYVHLWLNDVHDPHEPAEADLGRFAAPGANPYEQKFLAVLERMDRELGRLFDTIDEQGLGDKTLILLTGDNGPTAWPRYYDEGFEPPGSTGGLRGRKWSLYEGGIRQPLIVRWSDHVAAGTVDESTVVAAIDFFPTLCAVAGIDPPPVEFDGENQSDALLGEPGERMKPLFWQYGRDDSYLRPGAAHDRSPSLAVREGRWKLLMNADGHGVELYDLAADRSESVNIGEEQPTLVDRLSTALHQWQASLPGE